MELEDLIYVRYSRELAAIAALDRKYYVDPCPSPADRRDYAARQEQLETLRTRLYTDLAALRACREFRPCRSVIRRSRFRRR